MKKLLNIYFTAGYPEIGAFEPILLALQSGGADLVEIGLPYSDPLADGPTIQASSARALENGITLDRVFAMLTELQPRIQVPLYLMGYYNQWLSYGLESFCTKAGEAGVTGLIIPDLPVEYFDSDHQSLLEKYGLRISFLVTPDTPVERMSMIDQLSTGFVYVVSGRSTTGGTYSGGEMDTAYLQQISEFGFQRDTLVGFGIHDKSTFDLACQYTDGAIVGSAFIRHLERAYSPEHIHAFIQKIKQGK